VEDVKHVIARLPKAHTAHLTHVWLQKIKKVDYLAGETYQGSFICGSGVNLIVLHPFPVDLKMRLGPKKPLRKILNSYKTHTMELAQDGEGWYLQWTKEGIRKYYLESLLLHEVGHSISNYWGKATDKKGENYADNYATVWADKVKTVAH